MPKIEVKNLTKIIGGHPEEGPKRLHKTKILKETGMTIGVDNAYSQITRRILCH